MVPPGWKSLCHPGATGTSGSVFCSSSPSQGRAGGSAAGHGHRAGHLRRFWDHHSWLLTLKDELPQSTDPPSPWTPPAATTSGVSGTQNLCKDKSPKGAVEQPQMLRCSLRRNRKGVEFAPPAAIQCCPLSRGGHSVFPAPSTPDTSAGALNSSHLSGGVFFSDVIIRAGELK